MSGQISCRCGYRTEFAAAPLAELTAFRRTCEVVADQHEASDVRRPYRHETTILVQGWAR